MAGNLGAAEKMRFIHTSDWQIGKTFGFAEEAAQTLRDERLDVISRLGALALQNGAPHILVAGDIYDIETPADRTLRQPIERMRAFESLTWHLIPGNHDPHTPRGPWERLRRLQEKSEMPPNIRLHLEPGPAHIDDNFFLFPAILTRRHAFEDPTLWMQDAPTPEGALRIGLAHGSIASFGTDPSATPNHIAPDRAKSAGLAYLALGDWHGQQKIDARTCYSGTPETDDFNVVEGGAALLVDIENPAAPPVITAQRTGRFTWLRLDQTLNSPADIDILHARLRAAPDLGTTLLWLRVSGALSLEARTLYEERIRDSLGSALRVLRLEDDGLLPEPSAADIAAIDHAGFVRAAADRLAALAADPDNARRHIAASALQRLFVLTMQAPDPARA
jgi:DNA repair exonuclease SbcCD nuclease subunit